MVKQATEPRARNKCVMAFTMRFSSKVDIEKLDEIARAHSLTRKDLLDLLAIEAVKQGFVPRQKGEGFRAFTPGGGVLSLAQESGYVSSGGNNLTEDEQHIFEQAREMAKNGFWYPAKQTLIDAGFDLEMIIVQK
jgi:hypothetical protein